MKLQEILEAKVNPDTHWIFYQNNSLELLSQEPLDRRGNRETLGKLYADFSSLLENQGFSIDLANRTLRQLWTNETQIDESFAIPKIFLDDGFLRMYALGKPASFGLVLKIHKEIQKGAQVFQSDLNPIHVEWNFESENFHDVDATPPGILPKIFSHWRVKKDKELLEHIHLDLERISFVEDPKKRMWLTLAVLSHGAAYRELEGVTLKIPSFKETGVLVLYGCFQHLIAEGVKTVSMIPYSKDCPGIYLCQGTELWPSQPSMLGSVIANFAVHGAATEAYAHSWRRIHKHLRDLERVGDCLPFVSGHSMGGSMAIQIGLYSHDLVEKIYAFNPPMPHERDFHFYNQMSQKLQEKILISANLDDFAFWRIGAKIIGQVTIFMGKRRWRYYPVTIWDCLLLIPAFVKFILNVRHAFPAHQRITAFDKNFIWFHLSPSEIEKENKERVHRFDYLSFFPKLYDPMRVILHLVRKTFGWRLRDKYLQGEIEIISLHEKDLLDTMTEENKVEIEKELRELKRQKERLLRKLRYRIKFR